MTVQSSPSKSITSVLILALAPVIPFNTSHAGLPEDCPNHVYLGNSPGGTDSPDWSEQAQGIANDGQHWFFTKQNPGRIFKYKANWRSVDGDDPGKIASRGFPAVLADQGINHFGDPDYYGGYVFLPFEGGGPLRAVIAAYRATDLTFVDWVDVGAYQPKAGWVAVDPVEEVLYSSDDSLIAGTPLNRYRLLDLSKVDNGVQGDFLVRTDDMPVQDANGGAVAGEFTYMQGGVFTPWGDLYLIAGKAGESSSSTRGGIHLFRKRMTETGEVFRLLESSENVSVPAGTGRFAYEYHPGSTGFGEEPEGIDWWNSESLSEGRYPGQLHAILLDNQVGDDQIWLKHYEVDYFCKLTDDSDGDGVSDGDEVYMYNSHPLLADSDLDGVNDRVDNCPEIANPQQSDLDQDGRGDACDADADGDGQSNNDEASCGSDPLDVGNLAPDLDADGLPDCVDGDDDGDGQSDADETTCGSDPLDASSTSPDFDTDGVLDCIDTDDDNDNVADESDYCPLTAIPEAIIPLSDEAGRNRFLLLDNDVVFDRNGEATTYTTTDTGGCNAEQIAESLQLGEGHYLFGLSEGVLEVWIKRIQFNKADADG